MTLKPDHFQRPCMPERHALPPWPWHWISFRDPMMQRMYLCPWPWSWISFRDPSSQCSRPHRRVKPARAIPAERWTTLMLMVYASHVMHKRCHPNIWEFSCVHSHHSLDNHSSATVSTDTQRWNYPNSWDMYSVHSHHSLDHHLLITGIIYLVVPWGVSYLALRSSHSTI